MNAAFAPVYPGSGSTKGEENPACFLSRSRISTLAVVIGEQVQIDRIRESFVSGVGGVSMVSAIKSREYPCRLTGIAQNAIEIDYGIVTSAGADPRIEGLPL
jgi:thiamine monophosphate synthase